MTWPEHIGKVICGDAIETMKGIPAGVVQCCVTSPPYWGLRDYGITGQIGLESTPEEYITKMVQVFREVRRILRDDGSLWLNLGDSYWGPQGRGSGKGNEHNQKIKQSGGDFLKAKDLCMIPARVALALQADGWWLRSVIIWHKPSCMPESVTDRPTTAHEYVYLLAKSESYYYDADAIKEPATPDKSLRDRDHTKLNNTPGRTRMGGLVKNDYVQRNKRTVWTINPEPTPYAHFATFPQKLVEPPIMAGSKAGDIVLDPFSGSGTVGVVAKRLQRKYVLIDLSAEYNKIAEDRLRQVELSL